MKLNYENIFIALLFMLSTSVVLHDLYILLIKPFLTTYAEGFTWLGLITFGFAFVISITTFDYLYEYEKKTV